MLQMSRHVHMCRARRGLPAVQEWYAPSATSWTMASFRHLQLHGAVSFAHLQRCCKQMPHLEQR